MIRPEVASDRQYRPHVRVGEYMSGLLPRLKVLTVNLIPIVNLKFLSYKQYDFLRRYLFYFGNKKQTTNRYWSSNLTPTQNVVSFVREKVLLHHRYRCWVVDISIFFYNIVYNFFYNIFYNFFYNFVCNFVYNFVYNFFLQFFVR